MLIRRAVFMSKLASDFLFNRASLKESLCLMFFILSIKTSIDKCFKAVCNIFFVELIISV